jgi:hypothetical protein
MNTHKTSGLYWCKHPGRNTVLQSNKVFPLEVAGQKLHEITELSLTTAYESTITSIKIPLN